MKLADVDPSAHLKVLVYGDSGAGKTCFAAGFPTPILFLDFDGKVNSAASFYSGDKDRLAQIEVETLTPKPGVDPIQKFQEITRKLDKENPYKTIVIDSLTTFSAACLKHIVKTNPGIKRVQSAQGVQPGMQDYGILKREFSRLIPGFLTLDSNIVMCAHIKVDKDELTGEINRSTMMDGSFSQELPIYFEEVWRAYADDKGGHWAQTQSDYKFKCRSQIPGIFKTVELSYLAIMPFRAK